MNRRRAAASALAVGLVVLGAIFYGDSGDDLSGARAKVADAARWGTAIQAGETLAAVGEDLLRAGTDCGRGARCDDLLSASGWAQAAAVRVLRCTRPGLSQTRQDARDLLASLDERSGRRVALPAVPQC